ncbi:hypothetical protein [Aquella oligotrophica]|uniref:Uncharacterized protein n=1 Tax=Aquella oligotrophica TaxID=2067065 RepID=A0A2I7N6K6_9NEIS|nr:hypothetical protein [Aquella oligotrophica]AUR52072.1 hypothetical protein CUN60_07085 [Aquella oligotrophica]
MKYIITPGIADKLLPVAARGDIEGALLAILLNIIIIAILAVMISRFIKKSVHLLCIYKEHNRHKRFFRKSNGFTKQVKL